MLPAFYGDTACLQSEHILSVHLPIFAERFGPLSKHNAFLFENYYGFLVAHKSGTHIAQVNLYTNNLICLRAKC